MHLNYTNVKNNTTLKNNALQKLFTQEYKSKEKENWKHDLSISSN